MLNPATYDEVATLKNGLDVRIRAMRSNDKDLVLEMFRNLEPESIYTRFFHTKKILTEDDLKMITEVDFDNVVALAVTIGPESNETMIAGGRYACLGNEGGRREAEVAFTVEEDYHGQGIASMLLQRLIPIARAKGVDQFIAEVLDQNRAMQAVFSHSGLPIKQKRQSGAVHLVMSLTDDGA